MCEDNMHGKHKRISFHTSFKTSKKERLKLLQPNFGISYAMQTINMFMSNLRKTHRKVVKYIFRYLWGTTKKCLYFAKKELKMSGYVDANFVAKVDHWMSTVGYVFIVDTTTASWILKIQKIVKLSTIEDECSIDLSYKRNDLDSKIVKWFGIK